MEYQETGRFGRITKNLKKKGFEPEMKNILYDSKNFTKLKKTDQTKYIENVMNRMVDTIGQENTDEVLFACGEQCCGKSWSNFAKGIWNNSKSTDDFFINLNKEEKKYNTYISYNSSNKTIIVNRTKCICGLVNKGGHFTSNKSFCNCSIGHMSMFFNSIFSVKNIQLEKSILRGDDKCEWNIILNE